MGRFNYDALGKAMLRSRVAILRGEEAAISGLSYHGGCIRGIRSCLYQGWVYQGTESLFISGDRGCDYIQGQREQLYQGRQRHEQSKREIV